MTSSPPPSATPKSRWKTSAGLVAALVLVGMGVVALAVLLAAGPLSGEDAGLSGGGEPAGGWRVGSLAAIAAGVVAVVGLYAGLTLRRLSRALRQAEARLFALETAIDGRGFAILVADAQGGVRYANGLAAFGQADEVGREAAPLIARLIEPADDALPSTIASMGTRALEGESLTREFSTLARTGVGARGGAGPGADPGANPGGGPGAGPTDLADGPKHLQLTVGPFAGGAFYLMEDVSARRAEADLALERLSLLTRALDRAPFGIVVIDEARVVQEANSAFRRFLGGRTVAGQVLSDLIQSADRDVMQGAIDRVAASSQPSAPIDVRLSGDDDLTVAIYISLAALDREGERRFILHVVDATERKRLEAQFAQSQKMQAVGQLAGGIAHDFNNMLTAIIGFCDLMLQRHPVGEPSFADAMQIKQNANRAAGLVRQLLAFSRQQPLAPRVIDMTDVLAELSNLLRRLLGERVELSVVHGRDLWAVKADPGQIEQVVINLAVNARDAMPDGGKLTIQTSDFTADRPYMIGDETMAPGDYVAITVSDTGTGMEKHVVARVFEPFFTTKEVGMGTGLGLAMVYGTIRQLGGFVLAHSDGLGKGASFTLYLPRSSEALSPPPELAEGEDEVSDTTGGGKILLVEDEDAVRLFAARALRAKGYDVTEARTGESALEILAERPKIDLLVTDMVMPKVDGATLIREARKAMPDLPVICISGYTQEAVAQEVEALPQVYFLPKPFSLKQLATKVKGAIESAKVDRA